MSPAPLVRSILLLTPMISVASHLATASSALTHRDGRWELWREGKPFVIRGAGGGTHLALLAASGANTIRTWSPEQFDQRDRDDRTFLDAAAHHGLAVIAGLWLEHERHGFDYSDPAQIEAQRRKTLAAVRAHRHHPAVLLWGLGNEMEGPNAEQGNPAVWIEVNRLAQLVKAEDPDRLVMTVIAGAPEKKLQMFRQHCPDIDLLGVNCYGSAPEVPALLRRAGLNRPWVLTEFGPIGHWETAATSWGAPIEADSGAKAAHYRAAHDAAMADAAHCLGTVAFIWGHKQETTRTWFGMLLPDGTRLAAADVMAHAWTGAWPANRCPALHRVDFPWSETTIRRGAGVTASAVADDPENDPLTFLWEVVAETSDRKFGGDVERVPPVIAGCIDDPSRAEVRVRAPDQPGPYRLFLTVRDGRGGAATWNRPFLVE